MPPPRETNSWPILDKYFGSQFPHRWRIEQRFFAWLVGYLLVAAASVWIRSAIPITMGWSPVDEPLFVRHARYLKDGYWLGPYSEFTLIKGIAWPAFIAASSAAHIPLKIAEHTSYLISAAIVCLAMSRLLLNIEKRSLLRLMLSSDGLASKDAV
jgi:hypothetical protein